MNVFRLEGDFSHLLAIILLLASIWKNRSCAGISGKTQILLAIVYLTRYLDLFIVFISVYNSVMKVVFIFGTLATTYSIFAQFRATYDRDHDSFPIEVLIIPAMVLSVLFNHGFYLLEVVWTFSVYLEAVAILPQLYLIGKKGEAEKVVIYYLIALASYRGLYILNWIWRYYMEGHYDLIAISAGIVQVFLYSGVFVALAQETEKSVEKNATAGDGEAIEPIAYNENEMEQKMKKKGKCGCDG